MRYNQPFRGVGVTLVRDITERAHLAGPVETRRNRLRRLIKKSGADAMLVTSFTNVTYLTGFTGDDSFLLVTRDGEILITDFRYVIQLGDECPGLELEVRKTGSGKSIVDSVAKVIKSAKVSKLAIEADVMTVALHGQLSDKMPKVALLPSRGLVEELREIKDRGEVEQIRSAVKIAEKAFSVVRAGLRPEMTERQIADQLDHQIRLFGGNGLSFEPIVAVGERAALPHGHATDKKVCESDLLLIDWGAYSGHYLSDLTRVLVTGKISPKLERVYGVVLKAQQRAIASIKPGVSMDVVDDAARKFIAKEGFGKHFGHGLGHGIGLEIHENPRISKTSKQPLKAGMIVTVEPGIYLKGWGGVRIEDDVLVTKTGHEVLSTITKKLEDCIVV